MLTHGSFVRTQPPAGHGGVPGENGGGGPDEPTVEYRRRRTMAEPTMPILPECPSQENSSVSRMDLSIHSGGAGGNDTDAAGTPHSSQNASRKGSSAFHSSYTLSRADAPDIIIENCNIEEALDRLSNRRHDSVSSRDASTSTHGTDEQNNAVPLPRATPGSSGHLPAGDGGASPATSDSVSAGEIVSGLVDVRGEIAFMDEEEHENNTLDLDLDLEESYSSSELAGIPYCESTV